MISSADILKAGILIVDDQAANVALLEQMLCGAGYLSVSTTRNPLEVCELHRQNHYSLILLDLQMPVLDGFQVMAGLKSIETDGYLPVLVITAQPAHKLRALHAGAKDFVNKPFDLAEVLARVHNLLEVRLLHLETKRLYDRVVAEKKVSEQLLLIFRSNPGAMSITTVSKGRIIEVNEECCALFGYSRQEILGQNTIDLGLWAEPEKRTVAMELLIKEGTVRGFEARIRRRSGELRNVLVSLEVIVLANEMEPCLICTFTDFTQKKQAQDELLRAEAKYRHIFENAVEGIFQTTPDGRYLAANPALASMYGYDSPKELLATVTDIERQIYVDPNRRAEFKEALDQNQRVHQFGSEIYRKDGSTIEISENARAVRDENGKLLHYEGTTENVSERNRAEECLRASEERFRALFELGPVAVYSCAISGIITAFNRRAAELWGREPKCGDDDEKFCGAFKLRLLDGMSLPHAQCPMAGVLNGTIAKVVDTELIIERPDRSRITVLVNIVPLKDVRGTISGAINCFYDVTERKRSEGVIRESERRLREMLENVELIAIALDNNGHITFCNDFFLRLTGWSREEVIGANWFDTFIPVSNVKLRELFSAAIEIGAIPTHHQSLILTKAGALRDIVWNNTMLRDETGAFIGTASLASDITDEREAQQSLARESHLLRTVIDHVPDYIYVKDAQGRFQLVNSAVLRLLKLGRIDEALGKTDFDCHPTEQARRFADDDRQVMDTGQALLNRQETITGEDGSARSLLTIKVPLRDSSGVVTGLVGISRDVTERNIWEESLRMSEERFRQLAENIHDVFWLTDPTKTEMLYISPAYETIWGRSCESLYASPKTWMDAVHPEDRKHVADAVATKQAIGTYDEVYRVVRPDGSICWIRDCAFPIRNAAGAVSRIVGVARDITEQRQLENQLRQSQKMDAIGQLAGGIAHDFNNILGAIIGYAELVKMKIATAPPVVAHLDAILRACDRAADLVRQILTFSRRGEQERKVIHLKPIIDEAVQFLRASVPATIDIRTSMAGTPTVLADPTAIHQIVMNLGTNAWHAMRGQSGKLSVELTRFEVDAEFASTRPDLRPGNYVRLSVGDTGCGMDRATKQRIFEPFFTTKAPGEGTGLGLAVVHGIMKSHDGSISVHSQPGQGTAFHLYFPVYETGILEVTKASKPIPHGNGERILFVDDEYPLVELGKAMLERSGYSVTTKTDVTEAIALFRDQPEQFDLVVTDFAMPTMDGSKFAKELLLIRPGIPIILTTGYSGTLTNDTVKGLGFSELLLKPNNLRTLSEAVHRVLTAAKS